MGGPGEDSDNPFALSEGENQGTAISDNPLAFPKNKSQGGQAVISMIFLVWQLNLLVT